MRDDLISKIDRQDQQILEALVRIDDVKRNLSDLCVCDYRTEIVSSVRSFLHAKFWFNNSLRSLGCNNIKELLSSLDQGYIRGNPRSFSARVSSPGKVVINTSRKKPCWGLAFIGISLDFVGEWPSAGSMLKITGIYNYGGLLTWPPGSCRSSGSAIPHNGKPCPATESDGVDLNFYLFAAVGHKLSSLQKEYYLNKISSDGKL